MNSPKPSKALRELRLREAAEELTNIVLGYWKRIGMPEAEQNRRIRAAGRRIREKLR